VSAPEATELRLALATRAENLALVRQALTGLADAYGFGEEPLADLKQIATEGCMNAVVHAYPQGEGPMEVFARATPEAVELEIRDWGAGFNPRPAEADDTSLRLGLPLIATLADSFQIASGADGGTVLSVTVRNRVNGNGKPVQVPDTPDEAALVVTAGEPAKPVLSRVIALAATRAGFSLDRMSDGVLLGDAIAAQAAEEFADGRVGVDFTECGPNLCVRVGPFVDGGAERMLKRSELPDLGVSLRKLASRIEVESNGEGEFLVVEIEP
jgi:serine/threonine-protein kinase RsbW